MNTDLALQQNARTALACLDLTSLNDADCETDIAALCEKARNGVGLPAAVCVWPRLAAFARSQLPPAIAVAAVANFPHGDVDVHAAVRDTVAIVESGAQEVDVVLPWRALQAGDTKAASALLRAVRRACEGRLLKVILESGNLADAALIRNASQLALDEGADFLKTSTGKSGTGATPEAARVMLQVIQTRSKVGAPVAGFKASGGVRKVAEAQVYIELVREVLGVQAVGPSVLRIGASGLLDDIQAILGAPAQSATPSGSGTY
ncbi:MAG: deoxyribose-phosphate aldolase [Betaproteobacteria bacterium]|nr:deoxyribose-phosphate aldolase [Betaproteobacteria bacterium]